MRVSYLIVIIKFCGKSNGRPDLEALQAQSNNLPAGAVVQAPRRSMQALQEELDPLEMREPMQVLLLLPLRVLQG